ncbi:MAG: MraY family glycosyltransferase [Planctomycetota bacterium]|jgi:UDP-GlcNAc:undecaprenyl-phosphate GlcNAc-1-phosphate transferase
MSWIVLLLVPVGLAISAPLTALLVRLGHRAGTLDSAGADGHAKALRSVPNIGGVAIFVAVAAPLAAGLLAVLALDPALLARWVPAVEPHLPRLRTTAPTLAALLAGLLALHVLGLVDDRRSLGPRVKLAIEVAAAAVLVVWFDVRLLELLGYWPSVVVTVLWIVVMTNAVNFLDNMDGLAAGTCAIAASFFMVACLVNRQWFIAATLALLIGALLGFLLFNFPPARIFMGDGGSLIVGFLLAVLTARTTFYHPDLGGGWYAVLMPPIVLAIPLYDFATVTLIRLRQGRNPLVGDQQHFSHRLVERGLSRRGAVIVIWSATAVTGIGGISLGALAGWQAVLVGVQTLLVLVMLALLEHASRHARGRGSDAA